MLRCLLFYKIQYHLACKQQHVFLCCIESPFLAFPETLPLWNFFVLNARISAFLKLIRFTFCFLMLEAESFLYLDYQGFC